MIAYTGVETVSNLAEEARDPARSVPDAYKLVAVAVFAIYLTLPLVALSAMPVKMIDGQLTDAARAAAGAGRLRQRPDPRAGPEPRRPRRAAARARDLRRLLAATILFIATNAGVIGASRDHVLDGELPPDPEVFRRLHPKFKTPWLSLVVFAGILPILVILPGRRRLRRHAVLVRRDALVHRRPRVADRGCVQQQARRGRVLPRPAEPHDRRRAWPAVRDHRRHRAPGRLVPRGRLQDPATRWVGLGWIADRVRLLRRLPPPLRRRRRCGRPFEGAGGVRAGPGARVPAPARARS